MGFVFGALALATLVAGCSIRPKVSDTGYVGTWMRGNDRNFSMVTISKSGEDYLFRWRKWTVEGSFRIECGWDGRCEERLNGKVVATYAFKTFVDPKTGLLMVDGRESRIEPEKREIHYLDELVVKSGGRELWSYTTERDGQRYEGLARPMRSFEKVADAIGGVPPEPGSH